MRMRRLRPRRVLLAVLVAVVVGATTAVFTANVAVPATRMSQSAGPSSIDAQAAAAGCGTGLASVIVGTTGDAGNNLVLHDATGATVRGQGGDDCVMGGGGNDALRGDGGTDVCIGGPGTDTFHVSCETQIQ
jgi:Ca2+-binding RTX toxin-like protein